MFEEITIGSVVAAVTIAFIYYTVRLRRILGEQVEASQILKEILTEIRSRLEKQDRKLAEQEVRVDIIELKLRSILSQPVVREKGEIVAGQISHESASVSPLKHVENRLKRSVESGQLGGLNATESQALTVLREGPLSAREIEARLKRSREHTARLMKSLFERGLVIRDESKRPYMYRITGAGSRILE